MISLTALIAKEQAFFTALEVVRTLSHTSTFPSVFLDTSRIGRIFNIPPSFAAIGVNRPPLDRWSKSWQIKNPCELSTLSFNRATISSGCTLSWASLAAEIARYLSTANVV